MYADLSNEQLATVLRRRDQAPAGAWEEWLRRHGGQARAVASKALRRFAVAADLADDAVQLGALRFLQHLDRLDPGRPPLPYFLRIVGNSAVDIRRRELRHRNGPRALPARKAAAGPDEALALRDSVDGLLRRCSPEEQDLMTAHYLHGRSAREIARGRGLSVRDVYRRLHQGRCRLREQRGEPAGEGRFEW